MSGVGAARAGGAGLLALSVNRIYTYIINALLSSVSHNRGGTYGHTWNGGCICPDIRSILGTDAVR